MREFKISVLFEKKLKKLKGQELNNLLNKIDEILEIKDLDFYKNLKYDLKKFKRVHVNNSYVILFFGDNTIVYFVDYSHHDNIYKQNKFLLKKYDDMNFT